MQQNASQPRTTVNRRNRWRRGTIAVAVAVLAAACAPSAPTDTGSPTPPPAAPAEPSAPSEITIVTAEDPPTLEAPYGYSATTGIVLRNIQEPLVGRDRVTGRFVPLLATSWESVDDVTWRFDIREGVAFHDGSPLNAEAVAFALNISWSEEYVSGPLLGFKGPNFEVVAVSDMAVEVRLESPDPILPNRLWMSPIFSQQHFETQGEDKWREEPIGTGPYRFVEWVRGQSITIELNEDWWGHSDPVAADGTATIQRATYLIRSDQQSRIAAVRAGEAQLAERLPADQCLNDLGDDCLVAPNIDIAHIRIDTMGTLLSDVRIREAMALAIDRESIGVALLPGPPARMLVPTGAVGFNEDIPLVPFDPARARELVQAAAAEGVPVNRTINFRIEREKFPGISEVAQAIQAMWTDIGLTVGFEILDSAVFLEQVVGPPRPISADREWVILHQHSNRLADFAGTVTAWYRCGARISTYCNEEFDAIVDLALVATGAERQALLAQAAALAHSEYPFIPVIEMGVFHGLGPNLAWEPRADTNVYLKNMSLR